MRKPVVGWLAALAVSLAGCTSVGPVGYPVEYIDMHAPGHVWITQADKTVTEMYAPQVKGDTLVGFVKGSGAYIEIPVSTIQLMRAPQTSVMKTALFAGTLSIGMAVLVSSLQGTAPVCNNFAPGAANNGLVQPCNTTYGRPTN